MNKLRKNIMTYEERVKAKNLNPEYHLYEGDCIRCGKHVTDLSKKSDLCFEYEQNDLEYEEKRNVLPYDKMDKESEFRHEKSQQGWDDDMDEEIWEEHFR